MAAVDGGGECDVACPRRNGGCTGERGRAGDAKIGVGGRIATVQRGVVVVLLESGRGDRLQAHRAADVGRQAHERRRAAHCRTEERGGSRVGHKREATIHRAGERDRTAAGGEGGVGGERGRPGHAERGIGGCVAAGERGIFAILLGALGRDRLKCHRAACVGRETGEGRTVSDVGHKRRGTRRVGHERIAAVHRAGERDRTAAGGHRRRRRERRDAEGGVARGVGAVERGVVVILLGAGRRHRLEAHRAAGISREAHQGRTAADGGAKERGGSRLCRKGIGSIDRAGERDVARARRDGGRGGERGRAGHLKQAVVGLVVASERDVVAVLLDARGGNRLEARRADGVGREAGEGRATADGRGKHSRPSRVGRKREVAIHGAGKRDRFAAGGHRRCRRERCAAADAKGGIRRDVTAGERDVVAILLDAARLHRLQTRRAADVRRETGQRRAAADGGTEEGVAG